MGKQMPFLPKGFAKSVEMTIENWTWDTLPKNDSEVWDNLLTPIFLARNVRSAQASYVKNLLEPFLEAKAARRVRTDLKWSAKFMKLIGSELGSISGTKGEGLKRAILNIVAKDVGGFEFSRTVSTALDFFEKYGISVAKIKEVRDNNEETKARVCDCVSTATKN